LIKHDNIPMKACQLCQFIGDEGRTGLGPYPSLWGSTLWRLFLVCRQWRTPRQLSWIPPTTQKVQLMTVDLDNFVERMSRVQKIFDICMDYEDMWVRLHSEGLDRGPKLHQPPDILHERISHLSLRIAHHIAAAADRLVLAQWSGGLTGKKPPINSQQVKCIFNVDTMYVYIKVLTPICCLMHLGFWTLPQETFNCYSCFWWAFADWETLKIEFRHQSELGGWGWCSSWIDPWPDKGFERKWFRSYTRFNRPYTGGIVSERFIYCGWVPMSFKHPS